MDKKSNSSSRKEIEIPIPLNRFDSNIYLITAFKMKIFCFMLKYELQ